MRTWGEHALDGKAALGEYLARIGLAALPAPDPAGLTALVRAHRLAIPFENLDILLGRGISLAPAAIFAKLVTARRGGYCFEQNLLLAGTLRQLGLSVIPLLGRVRLRLADDAPLPPRTHLLLSVEIGGQTWLADAGFGGGYAPPMPLADGAAADGPDGSAHRLRRTGSPWGEWLLERQSGPDAPWQAQYAFDAQGAAMGDIECANHWTATRPGTRFTTLHLASKPVPEGLAALTDLSFSLNDAPPREISAADEWHRLLTSVFAIPLTRAEVNSLPLFDR